MAEVASSGGSSAGSSPNIRDRVLLRDFLVKKREISECGELTHKD
jgi:hypothetical protein